MYTCPRCLYKTVKKCNMLKHITKKNICDLKYLDIIPNDYKDFILRENDGDIKLLKNFCLLQTKNYSNDTLKEEKFPYNSPDDSFFTDEIYEKILKNSSNTIDILSKCLIIVYFKKSQNNSILKTNLNNSYFKVFNGKTWIIKKNIIPDILNNIKILFQTWIQKNKNNQIKYENIYKEIENIKESDVKKDWTLIIYNHSQNV